MMRQTERWGAVALACVAAETGLAAVEVFDFELDGNGESIRSGQLVNDEYASVFTARSSGVNAGVAAYDTSGAIGSDPDLEVGSGKALILQSAWSPWKGFGGDFLWPNDAREGGTITFDFVSQVEVLSIDLIDIDKNSGVLVTLTDEQGRPRVFDVPDRWTVDRADKGWGGVGTLDLTTLAAQQADTQKATTAWEDPGFDPTEVVQMDVEFSGSGALDNLTLFTGARPVPTPGGAGIVLAIGLMLGRRRGRG